GWNLCTATKGTELSSMKFDLSHFAPPPAALAGARAAGGSTALDPGGGSPPAICKKANAEPPHQSDGVSVCHLSPVKGRLDARTFNMEILPAVKRGVRATLVGPHGREHHENGLDVVPLTGGRSRLSRFFTAPAIAFFARRQPANIYH